MLRTPVAAVMLAGAASILVLPLARPAAAAPGCVPPCSDLRDMESALLQQEFLQARFKKYASFDLVPSPELVPDPDHPGKKVVESMIEAMQRDAREALT